MRNLAPVVVFTYNRVEHLEKTLDALNNCDLASETDLFIFCDSFKSDKDKTKVEMAISVVDKFATNNCFHSISITKASKNKGLAKSIMEGVTSVIALYGKAIVVEDDLIASRYFLRYMNGALDYYEHDKTIWAISGYTFPMKSLEAYPYDIYLSGRGCSWGWATWIDRWNMVDWNVSDYRSFKHNYFKRIKFGQWGKDLPILLDYQINLNANSWAIRWCYSAFTRNMLTVYPKRSYIKNYGIDGSGVHSQNATTHRFDTDFDDNEEFRCNFQSLTIDKKIRKEFAKRYSAGFVVDIKEQIKAFLIRNHLRKKI